MATRKIVEPFLQLIIKITNFDVSSEVSINYNLTGARPILHHEDDLAYQHYTTIDLTGKCSYPSERENDIYNISLIGRELHHGDFSRRLKDFHTRDNDGFLKYRKYRGGECPVYEDPLGISTISRRRGERIWDSHIWIHPSICSDILQTLTQTRPVYIVIDEYKEGRTYWLRSFSIQTKSPEEDLI